MNLSQADDLAMAVEAQLAAHLPNLDAVRVRARTTPPQVSAD
jgi:hypothetical protein